MLAFDDAGGLVGPFAGLLAAGLALPGPFLVDVDDGEPQELDDGVVGRMGKWPRALVTSLSW